MGYYNSPNFPMFPQRNSMGRMQFPWQGRQTPNISEDEFFQLTQTLDKSSLQKLVAQARSRGISDTDIKSGLDILLKH